MSLAGFKKQLNKANQFMSEKIGGAKGTELDDDYLEMERKTDTTEKMVGEIITKTQEFLQPNPAARAKLATQAALSKVRRQQMQTAYPQPENVLGDVLNKHGSELGPNSGFGQACNDTGEAFGQLGELKYTLEENIRQNFLEPLHQLQSKELKEIAHHRKKTAGRRLDYDCKKRKKDKGGVVSEEELMQAEEKFADSKELTETAMFNLLSNDVEQISQVKAFVDALLDYHQNAADILTSLKNTLSEKGCDDAARKPRQQHVPKRVASTASRNSSNYDASDSNGKTGSYSFGTPEYAEPVVQKKPAAKVTPSARALYDFEPENEGELGFSEGDMIELLQQIDDNWFEGKVNGQTGYFPINYVEVVNPL